MHELSFGESCFNNIKDTVEICNFPNLEKIIVKKESFLYVNILKICDNKQLKTIIIEDGDRYQQNDLWYSTGVFLNVKDFTLSSIFTIKNYNSIFPIYIQSVLEKVHLII